MTYEPKEGDVIERGRARILARYYAKYTGGEMYVTEFRRGIFGGLWHATNRTTLRPTELAALVNHMGWRLLP